jgi:hypothetical protein
MSAYRLAERTTFTTRRVWNFAAPDRPMLTEDPPRKGASGRVFAANHLTVIWDEAGDVVEVRAAGIVQHNGKDSPAFTSEIWRTAPFPDAVAEFLEFPAPSVVKA